MFPRCVEFEVETGSEESVRQGDGSATGTNVAVWGG